MPLSPRLSVLDLIPVRSGQSTAEAVAASVALAQAADRLGFTRYWFAEHHNMPSVASTTPPVLIAATAARTDRIRVGSGGVMLPNHAPLVVAEQFAALEALAPGRIDLGIGRAPGSDPVITQLLRVSGPTADVDRFPDHVADILSLLSPDGAMLRLTSGREYPIQATPAATAVPELWLLGSSDYSARLAAELGLPYVFANHFSGEGLEQALELYRSGYRPSERHPSPQTILTLNAVVADTLDEAEARALPQLRAMARLRLNRPMRPLETVEEAQAAPRDSDAEDVIARMRTRWVIGEADAAASAVRTLAERHGIDEVMLTPIAGARADEPADASPGRVRTLELLADGTAA
ncbi:LLM class flavin-dependent oxidoreductase [Agromyces sp. M3QZ16-3]|uniref:LLM class flavin-dependent oxidoreductase n=1 Tax=Agromyces sp. M3QZ16-3 TaxID=3447585 RepID=UPI003F693B0B